MSTSPYQQYVLANERWFRGRSTESAETLSRAEAALGVTIPPDLKWVISTCGYWHATGVCSLKETVEVTLLAREHADLPQEWIVLYDHQDGGVFLLNTHADTTTGEHVVVGLGWEAVPAGLYSDQVFPSLTDYAKYLIEGCDLSEDDIDYDAGRYEVDPGNRTSAEVVVLELGGAGVNQNLKLENESQT